MNATDYHDLVSDIGLPRAARDYMCDATADINATILALWPDDKAGLQLVQKSGDPLLYRILFADNHSQHAKLFHRLMTDFDEPFHDPKSFGTKMSKPKFLDASNVLYHAVAAAIFGISYLREHFEAAYDGEYKWEAEGYMTLGQLHVSNKLARYLAVRPNLVFD
jgi:hypothetical protein